MDFRGFISGCDFFRYRPEAPNEVVVKVERFGFAGGDAVHIDSGEERPPRQVEFNTGLLEGFPSGGSRQRSVARLDMTAGKEPTLQPVVVHEEHRLSTGMEHQRGACDVPRHVLIARKRRGCIGEKTESQFAALLGKSITGGVENSDDLNSGGGDQGS
jgi:hypothetical protein